MCHLRPTKYFKHGARVMLRDFCILIHTIKDKPYGKQRKTKKLAAESVEKHCKLFTPHPLAPEARGSSRTLDRLLEDLNASRTLVFVIPLRQNDRQLTSFSCSAAPIRTRTSLHVEKTRILASSSSRWISMILRTTASTLVEWDPLTLMVS